MKTDKSVKPPKVLMWNTNKPGGWKKYYEKTNENEIFDAIAENNDIKDDPELMMKSVDKELNNIKFDCFGKIKYRKNNVINKKLAEM